MILVSGATGLVGAEVCRRLASAGHPVRALVRKTSAPEKLAALQATGAELIVGDLKDPESLATACEGVAAVISTASSTLSRQPGDSIESVDSAGQLNLVRAAQQAGVDRFVFVSFRPVPGVAFPLSDAKREVEAAISGMNFTVIQASWFMEVWLSPALGFDYPNSAVRIYGPGTEPVSWVSYRDVAEMCVLSLRHPAAERRVIEFGGPEALTPLEVVERFEAISGRKFRVEHIPVEALEAQYAAAGDSMSKSFAGLMLGYATGDAMEMGAIVEHFGIHLTSVAQYARSVLSSAAPV